MVDVRRVAVHVQGFIDAHHGSPFFLYMPFSHVHTTAGNMPQKQCKPRLFFLSVGNPVSLSRMVVVCWCVGWADANCQHQNGTRRGRFGDALLEVDCTPPAPPF